MWILPSPEAAICNTSNQFNEMQCYHLTLVVSLCLLPHLSGDDSRDRHSHKTQQYKELKPIGAVCALIIVFYIAVTLTPRCVAIYTLAHKCHRNYSVCIKHILMVLASQLLGPVTPHAIQCIFKMHT